MSLLPGDRPIQIREVWAYNLEAELHLIGEVVDKYPYIGMDTEFPGTVHKADDLGNWSAKCYTELKQNVDDLKLIQLGLTFSDEKGNMPTCNTDKYCAWQFNFREFDPRTGAYNIDSIAVLRKAGIDFKRNIEMGIEAKRFAELLTPSGVVLNNEVTWLTFHSTYDFGYLIKILKDQNLPETQAGFLDLVNAFFPVLYDIKHVVRYDRKLCRMGLEALAKTLKVERVGKSHQAGSDSLVTSQVFMKLRETERYSGPLDRYAGVVHNLGSEYVVR